MSSYLKLNLAALAGLLLLAATPARAQDSGPLLDLLVKKGIVSDQEAEDLRSELLKDFAVNSPAGKLDLSTRVAKFALTGDVRARFQYDNEVANNFAGVPGTGYNNDRSRYRYRIRFGPTVTLANNWQMGFRLETAAGSTSTNDDFGAAGSANFAKDGNTAFVGQAWIEYAATNWHGLDRVNFKVGKAAHPFFSPGVNGFWIDTDINPEGLTEEITWLNAFKPGWSLALRGGQYVLSANSRTTERLGGFLNNPSVLLMGQAELAKTYTYENNPYGFRFAPAFVLFAGAESTGTTLNQADSATTTNYDNLATVILPIEYTFKVNNRPLAAYATYGYNYLGEKRTNWLYSTSATALTLTSAAGNPSAYNQMFNAGFRYGATRNPGDWQVTGEWRYVEPGAYTAILLDSDFNGGRTNGTGFIASLTYALTDAVNFTTTYFSARNIDKDSPSTVGFNRADVLQVDFSARF
jgi:hypothetical protein